MLPSCRLRGHRPRWTFLHGSAPGASSHHPGTSGQGLIAPVQTIRSKAPSVEPSPWASASSSSRLAVGRNTVIRASAAHLRHSNGCATGTQFRHSVSGLALGFLDSTGVRCKGPRGTRKGGGTPAGSASLPLLPIDGALVFDQSSRPVTLHDPGVFGGGVQRDPEVLVAPGGQQALTDLEQGVSG